ncbi:MAG: NAD(P)-dependent oxidoreductase [SAR202 cluster bacterium]|nr:NAD(P)-dependent oxidoreductase [SAR202 cluster bacterium]HCP24700.1 6-phosphogluconate dehydrogenase [Dehalococcoidia bacterium]
MSIETLAILSPGDMGHAIGRLLRENELRVLTCLTGRSSRTRELSELAGIIDVPDMNDLVEQSDIVMSVTVSEAVPGLCKEIADAVKATGTDLLFAECNAIAPALSREMEGVLNASGARYVDASIIGGPPRNGSSPRVYASGDNVAEFEQLRDFGLDVRNLGPELGRASGIKMCYAAMTKGTTALHAELLIAAEKLGLTEEVMAEFAGSQPAVVQRMEGWLPGMPAKSRRWVSEMQEIEKTFSDMGLTPDIFKGVAEMYRMIGATPLGDENPESRDKDRTLQETVRIIAENMGK